MFRTRSWGCKCNQNDNNNDNTNNNSADMEVIECPCTQNYSENMMNCNCGYDETSSFPANYMFGNSYVPRFKMAEVFTPDVALKMGTVFPELVSPYIPNQSTEIIEYLKQANEIKEGCNGYGM